jgi:hypothetical protein
LAKGTELPTVYKTGWLVVGLSAVLALAIVLTSNVEPSKKVASK